MAFVFAFSYAQDEPAVSPELRAFEFFNVPSRIHGLNLSIRYLPAVFSSSFPPILFIHGASFPSGLAFGFRMQGYSWMDYLSEKGFDVYALDFLGYGNADRYPSMINHVDSTSVLGEGREVVDDIHLAVKFILKNSPFSHVYLMGHSWGATISGYYAGIHPESVGKLVLFAPFVKREGPTDWQRPDYGFIALTPAKRIKQFISSIPDQEDIPLEEAILSRWGHEWLKSDKTAIRRRSNEVLYPSGWRKDLYDCWNNNCLLNPKKIVAPTMVIRGEWDVVLAKEEADWLLRALINTEVNHYVELKKSTHVAHLEKNRDRLYVETYKFLSSPK